MRVFRTVYVDKMADLDLSNLGCHWSASANYSHVGGGSNGVTSVKGLKVKFEIEVTESSINREATELSNFEHPIEKEIVINPMISVTAKMVIVDTKTRKFINGFKGETVEINTGTRMDKWVAKL